MSKVGEQDQPRDAEEKMGRANPGDNQRQDKPVPDILYSNADLQAILEKYEEERRKALEAEVEKARATLPPISKEISAAEYVSRNRDLIKQHAPQIFEQMGKIGKAEHSEMQEKGSYKPLNFTKGAPASLDILGKDNKPIYTLNYNSTDNLVIAKVPKSIDKGPMHLSLALQDANGENIEADKAAFFNISYGADGKIKSMNYPEPLEFEGEKCKFTIEGQPYYLKVTKTTLDALHAEVAQNRGQGAKRAQDVVGMEQEAEPQQLQPLVFAPVSFGIAPESPQQPARQSAPVNPEFKHNPAKGRDSLPLPTPKQPKEFKVEVVEEKEEEWLPRLASQAQHTEEVQIVAKEVRLPMPTPKAQQPKEFKIAVLEELLPIPTPQAQPGVVVHAKRVAKVESLPLPQNATRIKAPTADPEMPQQNLHNAAKAAAEAVRDMMGGKKEPKGTEPDPMATSQKDVEGKWIIQQQKPVVLGGAVKQQFAAGKPAGDPEHNKHSIPPGGVAENPPPLNIDKKAPAKKHPAVQPAAGLGGKNAKPFGDPKHNEFAVPPGGGQNEKPKWLQDSAKKNAVARSLRESSPAVESESNPLSPHPGGAATLKRERGRS